MGRPRLATTSDDPPLHPGSVSNGLVSGVRTVGNMCAKCTLEDCARVTLRKPFVRETIVAEVWDCFGLITRVPHSRPRSVLRHSMLLRVDSRGVSGGGGAGGC